MKVIKRNGTEQTFNVEKIKNAVLKANKSVEENLRMNDEQLEKVVETVLKKLQKFDSAKVEDIQDMVEASLVKHNKYEIAKAYIIFRQNKKDKKKFSSIEESALAILSGESAEARGDNANKHIDLNSSARDYLAGTVCKSLAEKTIPKDIWEAHKKGLIHWHDSDYYGMKLHNCDLIDLREMLSNGFMMGDTWIDSPKRFSTACNLAAQINLIVSGSQYGGQKITWTHLLPFVRSTFDDCKIELLSIMEEIPNWKRKLINAEKYYFKMTEKMVKRDIHIGIKTYQYQILCHHSSNGQTPFCSNVLCLREAQNEFEQKWLAFIIEEVLKRRIKGVKDKSGQYVSPLFPKLLYWECEGLNLEKKDPYYYLTELAAKCISTRCQPDINSEKKSREIKSGQIISSMGAVRGDELVSIKIKGEEFHNIKMEDAFNLIRKFNKQKHNMHKPNLSEFKDKCGVYKITHIPSGKYYIGSAKDIRRRLTEHRYSTRHYGKLGELYFINDFDLNNFKYEILEECNIDDLWEAESKYIDLSDELCVNHKDSRNNGNFKKGTNRSILAMEVSLIQTMKIRHILGGKM